MEIRRKLSIFSSLLFLLILAGCLSRGAPLEKITIGTSFNNMNGLLFIAMDKGLDRGQGLQLTIKPYQAGRDALKDVKAGLVDLACIGEFVLASAILAGETDWRCPCAISAGNVFDLIARRDRSISKIEDLRGKIIGVPLGTEGEFFLSNLLTLNHIPLKEVTVVNVAPSQMGPVMAAGKVDAVLWVPPFTMDIIKQMGDNAIALKAQGGEDYYVLLATRGEYLQARPASVAKLMRALEQAADFIKQRPGEARAIISKWCQIPVANLARYSVRYEAFLDQNLLLTMEDEAAWMIKNRSAGQTNIPDFLDYLDPGPLLKVDPKAVRLVVPGKMPPD